jgi:hypothetical protein
VIWTDQALTVVPAGYLRLPTGAPRPALLRPALLLPAEYQRANRRRAEVTWRADHYELGLTLDTGDPLPPPHRRGRWRGETWARSMWRR